MTLKQLNKYLKLIFIILVVFLIIILLYMKYLHVYGLPIHPFIYPIGDTLISVVSIWSIIYCIGFLINVIRGV